MRAASVKPLHRTESLQRAGQGPCCDAVHRGWPRRWVPGGAISPWVSFHVEGEALYRDRVDLVCLPLPASSCPPPYLSWFPFWQPLLSSTATSSRKSCLILLVESSLAHSCFCSTLWIPALKADCVFKSAKNIWG